MPRASMRLTGKAAGDLRRPWRASSAVSCESRGGFCPYPPIHSRGASQSGGWSPPFLSFSGVGNMSEEWDEVRHEVDLMMERLSSFCDDLSAAQDSGALTELQIAFCRKVTAWALLTAVRIRTCLYKDETAKESRTG